MLITWDRYEFRPLPKWKFSEVFAWDRNETKAMFFEIFRFGFRAFVLTRVGPAPKISETSPSFFFEPVSRKQEQGFVRGAISNRAGLTSYRSHVISRLGPMRRLRPTPVKSATAQRNWNIRLHGTYMMCSLLFKDKYIYQKICIEITEYNPN